MQKGRNRDGRNKPDQSLPRTKILRGKRNFQRLFEKAFVLSSNSVQFRFRIYNDSNEGFYIGFIAPKRIIKSAVQRNKTKRYLREVYRLNQSILQDLFFDKKFGMHGVFIAARPDLTYSDVQSDMIPLLNKAREKLQEYQPRTPSSTTDSKK
ncbi:MAG: ribonuclease P protein component [Balneolaceae bacterium]